MRSIRIKKTGKHGAAIYDSSGIRLSHEAVEKFIPIAGTNYSTDIDYEFIDAAANIETYCTADYNKRRDSLN